MLSNAVIAAAVIRVIPSPHLLSVSVVPYRYLCVEQMGDWHHRYGSTQRVCCQGGQRQIPIGISATLPISVSALCQTRTAQARRVFRRSASSLRRLPALKPKELLGRWRRIEVNALECEHAPFGGRATRRGKPPDLAAGRQDPVAGDDIIFPWFGPGRYGPVAPQHGFARTAMWHLDGVETAGSESLTLTLSLGDGDVSSPFWPEPFRAIYTVTFARTLSLRLAVQNRAMHPI